MAGIKIVELPQASSLGDEDMILIEQGNETKSLKGGFIKGYDKFTNYYLKKEIDDKDTALNEKINTKGTKDGTLQLNLNAEKVGGKAASDLVFKTDFNEFKDTKGKTNGLASLDEKGNLKEKINVLNLIPYKVNTVVEKLYDYTEVQSGGNWTGVNKTQNVALNLNDYESLSLKIEMYLNCSVHSWGGTASNKLVINGTEVKRLTVTSISGQTSANYFEVTNCYK